MSITSALKLLPSFPLVVTTNIRLNIAIYSSRPTHLIGQLADTTSLLDLLLSQLGEVSGPDDNGLAWHLALTEDLEDTGLGAVDDGGLFRALVSLSGLLSDQRPNLLNVEGWLVVSVSSKMEVSHTNLTEVTRVILIHVDSVVMLTTSLTTTTGVLAVLANTAVTHADVTS